MNLVKQATRHLAQGLCLSGQHADRFLRLRADLVSGLLDHDRVAGQQLAQMRRLATERCLDGARMLSEYAIDLACALAEGSVDRLETLGERSGDLLGAVGKRFVHSSGLLADGELDSLALLDQ